AGPPPVPLSRAVALLGRRTMPVPYSLAKGVLRQAVRLGVTSFPAPELDFIRYVCMVDDTRARRELGYRPAYDLEATLRSVDEERWVAWPPLAGGGCARDTSSTGHPSRAGETHRRGEVLRGGRTEEASLRGGARFHGVARAQRGRPAHRGALADPPRARLWWRRGATQASPTPRVRAPRAAPLGGGATERSPRRRHPRRGMGGGAARAGTPGDRSHGRAPRRGASRRGASRRRSSRRRSSRRRVARRGPGDRAPRSAANAASRRCPRAGAATPAGRRRASPERRLKPGSSVLVGVFAGGRAHRGPALRRPAHPRPPSTDGATLEEGSAGHFGP